jgi:hypothetical protein
MHMTFAAIQKRTAIMLGSFFSIGIFIVVVIRRLTGGWT